MLPKTGKRFPTRDGTNGGGIGYAEAIAAALKEELGDTHRATKTVMRWTGAGERTAKNWLIGAYGPTGEHLILLAGRSDKVLQAFLRLAGREPAIGVAKLVETRRLLLEILEAVDTHLERQGYERN